MYDLTQWFMMPLKSAGYRALINGVSTPYGRDTHHLEGTNLTNNTKVYAYHWATAKTMVFTKTPGGFPWDIKPYDQNFIYDLATELDWTNPRNYKAQATPMKMCPRFWDGDPTQFQFTSSAMTHFYKNCVDTNQPNDVGPVYYTLQGPFWMDFGGTVGTQQTILLSYYWKDKKNREQIFLTQWFGWVKWTHANLVQLSPNTAEYMVDAEVVHNQLVAGSLAPSFPCITLP